LREYWLVDPDTQTVGFCQLGAGEQYNTLAADVSGVYQSAVIRGLWLRVKWLWQRPLPKTVSILGEWGLVCHYHRGERWQPLGAAPRASAIVGGAVCSREIA